MGSCAMQPKAPGKGAWFRPAYRTFFCTTCWAAQRFKAAKLAELKAGRTEKQFIKHPATWLNDACWQDDVGEPAHPNGAAPGLQPYWWRKNPGAAKAFPAEAWAHLIQTYSADTWSEPMCGPPAREPGCLIPRDVIRDLKL